MDLLALNPRQASAPHSRRSPAGVGDGVGGDGSTPRLGGHSE
jgi:hypothetical protein